MVVIRTHASDAPARAVSRQARAILARIPRQAQPDDGRDSASGFDLRDSRTSHIFKPLRSQNSTARQIPNWSTSTYQLNFTTEAKPSNYSEDQPRPAVADKQTRPLSTRTLSWWADLTVPEQVAKARHSTLVGKHSQRARLAAPGLNSPMSSEDISLPSKPSSAAQHKPLVVGRTKPQSTTTMDSSSAAEKAIPSEVKAAFNHEVAENVKSNTSAAAPDATPPTSKPKKEKAPKQPKQPKAPAAPIAPVSPALIDLRVGHILRAIAHPNADSLYVSTIAMGDPEGTDHTQVDEETGKVVRTVCSGLNGLVPLEEMQDRKIIVVANLKPVNMRSIKSAAMVLAASPPAEEGADPHAADRVVELVNPPEGAEVGDLVYFEGWPYGEGKGPEKQLNPKKKVWESVQPGFFTGDDLTVGFDAGRPGVEIEGEKEKKGWLVVEGKGSCTVKTLKGAVVR